MLRTVFEVPPGRALRLLALGSHPDDIEIGCGGTILRLLTEQPKTEVRWVVLSGDERRAAEARGSAGSFLGAAGPSRVDVHGLPDSYFPDHFGEVKAILRGVAADFEPDIVLSHRREDLHQDHRLVGEVTWQVFRHHLILEYEVPKYEGDLGTPSLYVPLDPAQVSGKIERLLEHFPSQREREWFDESTFRAILRLRGLECHAASGHAEAFTARRLVI